MKPWLALSLLLPAAVGAAPAPNPPLVVGKYLTPQGRQTQVGSFPDNLTLSPDGRFVVVTNAGFRQYLTVLRTSDGAVASQLGFNAKGADNGGKLEALYYGLAFGKAHNGATPLYVARGYEGRVTRFLLDAQGKLTSDQAAFPSDPKQNLGFTAGVALAADGSRLYVADNATTPATGMRGKLAIFDPASGAITGSVPLPGYPLAVAEAAGKVFVTSERDAVVSVVDPATATVAGTIPVGDHPMAFALDAARRYLYVANAGSDTVSVIDTAARKVKSTILLRPDDARGLCGATPTGLALAPNGKRLYVTLADMNAVAVVDVAAARVVGYIPVGWYPTSVVVSRDGARLFVTNARGVQLRNPNKNPAGPNGAWTRYIPRIVEGTVSELAVPTPRSLPGLTARVLANNLTHRIPQALARPALPKTGIQHVIYIIKENRTYDQVLGDLPQGNGDASICMFPRRVTPNQHALAERFVLFDNYYCCAEVSADGWEWSTSGMESSYAHRNTPTAYSGRGRTYDEEGENSGVPVDLFGIKDVARPPSGYIWDLVARKKLSYRNYGFFVTTSKGTVKTARGEKSWGFNKASKRVLVGHTDEDFLQFDTRYADSDAWVQYNCPSPTQTKTFGSHNATCRFNEWKLEFDRYVKNNDLPRFMMVRLMRDHTQGTAAGASSPRAMVADNDYAVGRLVEEVSKSPFWKSTAIFIVEDDAQDGWDHVDAHRSTCYVVSPYVKRAQVDHRFYNTDSTLRTMEILLGLPPLCQYDAAATPLQVLGATPDNVEPFQAILPGRDVIAEVNQKTAYRAGDSAKLNFRVADAVPDDVLNDILWGALKPNQARPAIRHTVGVVGERREERGESAGARRGRRETRDDD